MNRNYYQAIALIDRERNIRQSVDVEAKKTHFRFQIDGESKEWNYQDVILEAGGNNGSLLYIKHKQETELSLYTRDKKILNNEFVASNQYLSDKAKQLRVKSTKIKSGYFSLVVVCLIFVAVVFRNRSGFVQLTADAVPVEWEEQIGNKLFNTISGHYNIDRDSSQQAYLDSLFLPLTNAIGDTARNYQFFVCKDTTLNAFALPGGYVVINSGTIEKAGSSEELFGVVAHELAHVTQRHHLRGMISNIGLVVFFQGVIGGEAGLIGLLGESSLQLGSMFFSREYEYEADNKGFEYLRSAGINPEGMIAFFHRIEKLQEEERKKIQNAIASLQVENEADSIAVEQENAETEQAELQEKLEKVEGYLSSHPPTVDRIKNLNSKIENGVYTCRLPSIEAIQSQLAK